MRSGILRAAAVLAVAVKAAAQVTTAPVGDDEADEARETTRVLMPLLSKNPLSILYGVLGTPLPGDPGILPPLLPTPTFKAANQNSSSTSSTTSASSSSSGTSTTTPAARVGRKTPITSAASDPRSLVVPTLSPDQLDYLKSLYPELVSDYYSAKFNRTDISPVSKKTTQSTASTSTVAHATTTDVAAAPSTLLTVRRHDAAAQ